ncbi:lipocalin-15 isoform X6 [Haemorhous mexicanus]|uniref:lipocalin-15 isoform X6 n=1 Tax=Haemorhous mexicanus TaxID=30427 RepID=UPI0028BE2F2B|nr:lipocalin-15 isoform X6 [Haemorhous mexicanus]
MTAALPSLVLALLCLLQARAQVPVQPDLDTKKFAGEWHVTAIASNCSIFLKMKDGMKSSMAIVSFTPEENLAMKLVWPLMDKCQEFELLFQQSGQAGHYMVTSGVLRSTREEESECDGDRLQPLCCPPRRPAQRGRAQHSAATPQSMHRGHQSLSAQAGVGL